MAQHIGIVGCSAEGAALCYRTVCGEGAARMGQHNHPEVSLHTHALHIYMDAIFRDDWDAVGKLMLDSAARLQRIGAELLICPDNTIHQALDRVIARSPLPWLHIAEEVAAEAERRGFRCVGLTGTKVLMEGPVYPPRFAARGIRMVLPSAEQRAEINRLIFEELVNGIFLPEALAYFQRVIGDLKRQGCDAVALSCTEIPLLVSDATSPLPVLDSTRLLARAAVCRAVGAPPGSSAPAPVRGADPLGRSE
jgi:aspartate racemase